MNPKVNSTTRGKLVIHDSKTQPALEKKPTIITDYSSKKPTRNEQKEAQSSLSLLKQKMRTTMKKTTTLEDRGFDLYGQDDGNQRFNDTLQHKKMATEQNLSNKARTNQTSMNKIDRDVTKKVGQTGASTKQAPKVDQPPKKTPSRTTTANYNTSAKQNDDSNDFEEYTVNKYINSNTSANKQVSNNNDRFTKDTARAPAKNSFKGFSTNSNINDEREDLAYEKPKPSTTTFTKKPTANTSSNKVEPRAPAKSKPATNQNHAYNNPVHDDEVPIKQIHNQFEIPSDVDEDIELVQCPAGCGKSFRPDVVPKHAKICKKVFQQKRKPFDVAQQRQIDEMKEMQAENKYKKKPQAKAAAKPKAKEGAVPKWKLQSALLRNGLRAARGGETKNSEEATMVKKFEEQEMARCPFCNRTFNDEAAKRHIPFCEKKAKDNKLKGAPQKKVTPAPVKRR